MEGRGRKHKNGNAYQVLRLTTCVFVAVISAIIPKITLEVEADTIAIVAVKFVCAARIVLGNSICKRLRSYMLEVAGHSESKTK